MLFKLCNLRCIKILLGVFLLTSFVLLQVHASDVAYKADRFTLIKTVAHKQLDDSWRCICKNEETDVAYYVFPTDFPDISTDDIVTVIEAGNASVVSITPDGFYLDCSTLSLAPGMSGTPVVFENKTCGYVSAYKQTGYLYCIWSY